MSDTPRTDAETGWPFGPKGKIKTKAFYQEKGGAYVLADVARNLEMELKCMEDSLRSSGLTAARARIAESESEALEQARLLSMSGEREARLLARIAALEQDKARHAADAARLDWLEANEYWIEISRKLEPDHKPTESFLPTTARQAIDAAMRGQTK
jgi:hypothetical protein